DELRAVLHEQQHPVATLDVTALLQEGGERVDLGFRFAESERAVVVDQPSLVGVACGRHLQVVVEAGLRVSQAPRQLLRPEPVMARFHAPPLRSSRGAIKPCESKANARTAPEKPPVARTRYRFYRGSKARDREPCFTRKTVCVSIRRKALSAASSGREPHA